MGTTATIHVYNPLVSAARVLVAWGSALGSASLVTAALGRGEHAVTFPVGHECEAGCRVDVHVAAPADAQRTSLGGGLPLSKLLEPRAPMLASFSMEIDAPPRSDAIRVHVAPTFEVAPPGDGAGAKVRCRLP